MVIRPVIEEFNDLLRSCPDVSEATRKKLAVWVEHQLEEAFKVGGRQVHWVEHEIMRHL